MNAKNKKGTIGIVGGMGPEAGIDLASKLVRNTVAYRDQEHLPLVLHSFPADIDDRTEYVEGKVKVNPGHSIARILCSMEQQGAGLAGIACNSAHIEKIFSVVLSDLEKNGRGTLRLLNMITEMGIFIRKHYPGKKRVGILGTTGTYISSSYSSIEGEGVVTVNLDQDQQSRLHSAIYHPQYGIKSLSGVFSHEAKSIFYDSCSSIIGKGADIIVLACTELSVAYPMRNYKGVPVVDSNTVLARALVNAFDPSRLKPWGGWTG